MFKVNNKDGRTMSMVSLFLTLLLTIHILVSLLLTLNIFHILHGMKNVKIHALYWKKERKVSLTDCKLKCFFSRVHHKSTIHLLANCVFSLPFFLNAKCPIFANGFFEKLPELTKNLK